MDGYYMVLPSPACAWEAQTQTQTSNTFPRSYDEWMVTDAHFLADLGDRATST